MVQASADKLPSEGQLKKLLKVYSKGLRRHPNNLDLRTKLAEVLRLLHRVDEAIALYSSVAWAHGVAGNLGQSITLCKIILQLQPEHSETQQMLAKLYASKRIRDAKQSIPVVRVDGKWVADPRGTVSSASAPSASAPSVATPVSPTVGLEKPPGPTPPRASLPVLDQEFVAESTKNETPSSPDMMARRSGQRQLSPEPAFNRDARATSAEIPAARRRSAPDLQPEGSGKVRSPFAVAPTSPVVVTTDGKGQLVMDPGAGKPGAGKPTLQLTASQVDRVVERAPQPVVVGDVDMEEPTQLEAVPDDDDEPPLPPVVNEPPPPPADEPAPVDYSGQQEPMATEVRPPTFELEADLPPGPRLSPAQMMEHLSRSMPMAHSGEFQRQALEPPNPEDVLPDGTGKIEMVSVAARTPRTTSHGFLSASDQTADPLRFVRTTRRYATVEDDAPLGVDTFIDPIDPNLVSAVVQMDLRRADPPPVAVAKGYAALQAEVRQAGNQQEEQSAEVEVEDVVGSLMDTLREVPQAIDPLDREVSLPKVPYPLFSDLDTPAFLAMVEKLERRVCPAGGLVFQEGDPGDSLFLVSSGNLEVLKKDDKGRLIDLAHLGPGSFFGEFALLTDRHRHASVRCIDECELLELRRDVLSALIQAHPSISWTLRIFYQQRLMAMVLATSPLFQAVSPDERREVLSRFTIRRIMEGELIIQEGRPGTGFYVILVGEVSVTCRSEDGSEIPLGILSEGDYFGEISLLTGTAAEATVRANVITEVLTLGASDFYDLASAHPEIWAEVQKEAERRQKETMERQREQARRVKAAGPLCLI